MMVKWYATEGAQGEQFYTTQQICFSVNSFTKSCSKKPREKLLFAKQIALKEISVLQNKFNILKSSVNTVKKTKIVKEKKIHFVL